MKKFIFFIITILAATTLHAQNAKAFIKFSNKSEIIKDIHEEKGIVSISYKFVNTGNAPLIISKANTSTSRIKIDFPRKPILPNEGGEIKVKYDPTKKKGNLDRSITVISNAKNRIAILYLKGNVIARPLTIKEQYPTVVDKLRYKRSNNRMYFGDVKNTEVRLDTVYFMNNTKESLKLEFKDILDYIDIKPMKMTLAPNAKANFIISLDARGRRDYGYMYERLSLYVNGKHKYKGDLTINANIIEDFSYLSKRELKKAPKMVFEETRVEFGNLTQGEKATHVFKFKNEGKSDLIIRKIKTSCGCTAVNPESLIIKAGKDSKISITFNSKNKRGRQHKFIYIICNDPQNHTTKLQMIGNILMPKAQEK